MKTIFQENPTPKKEYEKRKYQENNRTKCKIYNIKYIYIYNIKHVTKQRIRKNSKYVDNPQRKRKYQRNRYQENPKPNKKT